MERKTDFKRTKTIEAVPFAVCILAVFMLSSANAFAQEYQTRDVSESIVILSETESGETQVALQSERGLVVFNTYWSEVSARRFKREIAKTFGRDDFIYVINTMDRLDMFGGNAAYGEAEIVGHSSFTDKYQGKEDEVEAEITQLAEMWRRKEDVCRERLPTHEEGSEAWIAEKRWMTTCKRRADELEQSFSLVLPTIMYDDRTTLSLGNITLQLFWFGKAGNYNGMTVTVIPEEKTAIIPTFIMHPQHFAPHPHGEYKDLDVPRWISVLEEILEGDNAVETVVCGMTEVWPRERAHEHLEYIRRLWYDVQAAEAQGKSLSEVQARMSFENDFSFVKQMRIYEENGDEWLRPQHLDHVRLFYLQHKNLASEIIMGRGMDSLEISLTEIRDVRNAGGDIYFEEASINRIGYHLMQLGRLAEAIEIFKLNVEVFPESWNVYDSLGEAYMKHGDRERALDNYNKSLEMNPDNENARRVLEELREG